MQRKTAMVALSLGWLAGCGPHNVDLGGGQPGTGGRDEMGMGTGGSETAATGGTGAYATTGGTGGGYATGGTGALGEPAGMGAVGGSVSTGGGPAMGGQAGSTYEQVCGDGVVEPPEICDDGLDTNGMCPADCGVGVTGTGGGPAMGGMGGVAGTTGSPLCGDGIVEEPEICDDGNTADGDSCASDCLSYCLDTACVGGTGGSGGGLGVGGGPAMGGMGGSGEICIGSEISQIGECLEYEVLVQRSLAICDMQGATLRTLYFASCQESPSYAFCCRGDGAGTGGVSGMGGTGTGGTGG